MGKINDNNEKAVLLNVPEKLLKCIKVYSVFNGVTVKDFFISAAFEKIKQDPIFKKSFEELL